MASKTAILRRALLYVPSSSQKMLDKTRRLPNVDCVGYDLEDSVTLNKKADARANLRNFLQQGPAAGAKECAVRINPVGSKLEAEDLEAVCNAPHLDAIVIPKVNEASHLRWTADFIAHNRTAKASVDGAKQTPIKLIALIESAKAISNLTEICRATPLLSGLIFAAEDFALDLSLTRTPSLTEFLYARSAIVTAARAHEIPSIIDLVCTSYKGEEGRRAMEEECLGGKSLGFNGKQCIHPDQVDIAQRAFAPSEGEVTWAVRIIIANEKAERAGRGAWTLDGKMIDAPVIGRAASIVAKAKACGIDIDGVRENWKHQEPE